MASSTDSPELIDFSDSSPPTSSRQATSTEADAQHYASGEARHRWQHRSAVDETIVLEADHPLMKRFQESLKSHLERLNSRLAEETLDLDAAVKLKQKEREELGNLLFSIQQEVTRQQTRIDEFGRTLASLLHMRDEMDGLVAEAKGTHKAEVEKLNSELRRESELRTELEKLMALERQLEAWAEDTEAELTVSQRISEKTRVEKKQRTAEKRQQDMLIYRMMTDVSRLSTRLKTTEVQFAAKERERDQLCDTLVDADADLQALTAEQSRALQAWHSVVIATQQRDTLYTDMHNKLCQLQMDFHTLQSGVEALRRSSLAQQERHEELSAVLRRARTEAAEAERKMAADRKRRRRLETRLMETAALLQQTDEDLARMQALLAQCQTENRLLDKELDRLKREKVGVQDSIVAQLQEKATSHKAVCYMSRLVAQARDKTQHQELVQVEMENALSASMLDKEQQESTNQSNRLLLDELRREQNQHERVLDQLALTLKQRVVLASKRQTQIDSLNKKLEIMTQSAGGMQASPLELKTVNLERSIQETQQRVEKLKPYWLRQEGLIVQLSQQRNQQLYNINILRKQVSILDQKNVRTEYEIGRQAKEEQAVLRSVAGLLNRLATLNVERCNTQGYQHTLDKDNHLMHSQFLHTLKEEELASLQLEAEIAQLAEDRLQLSAQLIAVQRENLAWEKKLQMAVEAKQTLDRETRADGDVGGMRAEIHRMQVRESQLRRVQERLVADLQHCVSRREAIVDSAEAKNRRTAKATGTRRHFHKQLEDLANKIKHTDAKSGLLEVESLAVKERQQQLMRQLEQKQQEMRLLHEAASQVDVQLEDAFLHRHKNLEQLVRRQKKVRHYGNIKQFSHRPLYKSVSALDSETARQQVMHSDLVSVVEALLGDFPDLRLDINKVLNTLRLQPS